MEYHKWHKLEGIIRADMKSRISSLKEHNGLIDNDNEKCDFFKKLFYKLHQE